MDSEDDMVDANDVESGDDDYYSGEMEEDCSSDDGGYGEDDADYDYIADNLEEADDIISRLQQQYYTVLKEEDIRQCQEDDILNVTAVLSIPRVEATILLCYYNWSVSKVNDEWFANEEVVRKTVGLLNERVVQISNAREVICGICFESLPLDNITSTACGHPFCKECWSGPVIGEDDWQC